MDKTAADSSDLENAEHSILQALESGDEREAMDLMMGFYGAAIYRFCRRMVGDEALAEDAHQLTFIQAFESLGSFQGRSSIKTWLFSIARHRCLDCAKSRTRRWARFLPLPSLKGRDQVEPDLDQRLEQSSRRDGLLFCLRKLQEKTRVALLLRFQSELSYPEMAEICDERAPTLQARVARSLPVLRRCLEGRGQGQALRSS